MSNNFGDDSISPISPQSVVCTCSGTFIGFFSFYTFTFLGFMFLIIFDFMHLLECFVFCTFTLLVFMFLIMFEFM